jgi:hypothetical protein
VPPKDTVNVTVPVLTVPPALVTLAINVTFWLLSLKDADVLDAVVVVGAAPTVKLCEVSALTPRLVVPLYAAAMV